MSFDNLHLLLHASQPPSWLASLGVADRAAAQASLARMIRLGVPLDLMEGMIHQLSRELPRLADPDMALRNLEAFVEAARSRLALAALLDRDPEALPTLLPLFSASQHLSEVLARDPESYDLLRVTQGRPFARDHMVEEIVNEVNQLADRKLVLAALQRYKNRGMLRIAYGDIVRGHSVAQVTRQISYLAEAIVEAAYGFVRADLEEKLGVPREPDGTPTPFVVLALGKLGGIELNYSSDIDLIFIFRSDGQMDGRRPITHQEFFERLARELIRLLSESTVYGAVYKRVDLRLRPEGSRGPLACSLPYALAYYDSKGRTWERQAYLKARPIAGDKDLGHHLLRTLEPWIYRRFLSLADITGIKTLKRRLEKRAKQEAGNLRNVKEGPGGIRDIEFVIQFLQLLNGGELPAIRTGNTLESIARLEEAGCLTPDERAVLEPNYSMLRKLEHRLQIMFNLNTRMLPNDPEELHKLAVRMDYKGSKHRSVRELFEYDFERRTRGNREILRRLLHDPFSDEGDADPEIDLVNDPDPKEEQIEQVLRPYGFLDIPAAYENLMGLAQEPIRFLSTRRCRHFLASIAPRLLTAISKTPDPDGTLMMLCRVSDSLGGKAALWELLSQNNASMNLYVTLCTACPYLAGILTSHPGMVDELMDSLVLERLPTLGLLEAELAEVAKGAEDIGPVLHSFKSAQHLRVGVRDLLGKDDIQATHRALSDIAEACVRRIALVEQERLIAKFGQPIIGPFPPKNGHPDIADPIPSEIRHREGQPCEMIILALGKIGGREPNYHSDLDLVFLYEAEGQTVPSHHSMQPTTNAHFFSEMGQRIIRMATQSGSYGFLYEIDMRLRPTGKSGILAVPVEAFDRYFATGGGLLWERQALCKARVIYGSPAAAGWAMQVVAKAAYGPRWKPEDAKEIRSMRMKMESESNRNLKRGPGGTVDIEFLVQALQLKYGRDDPTIHVPGTLRAIDALREGGYLSADDAAYFDRSYRFQRSVEARIRLMNSAGRHELPTDAKELGKLAFLLGYDDPNELERQALEIFRENRARFNRIIDLAARQ
ncbi:MAG: hypothetical protein JW829_04255 [Pirellulales bacterium]|nr:hypothetical protein [Pirellulales bacterium]